jgi:hypothetical protein
MPRWEKKNIARDDDYQNEPEIVESKEPAKITEELIPVKVGDQVGDIIIQSIFGKHPAMYNPVTQRLVLLNGVTVDASHKDLEPKYTISFSGGTPKVVGFNKAAFKAGLYELI